MKQNEKFNELIDSRKTDKTVQVSGYVSFVALFSVVVRKPVGLISNSIVVPSTILLSMPQPLINLIFIGCCFFIINSAILTLMIEKNMEKDGILQNFMTMIYSDYFIPKLLIKFFGKEV